MSRIIMWVCDGCGVAVERDTAARPAGWVEAEPGEARDLCGRCASMAMARGDLDYVSVRRS